MREPQGVHAEIQIAAYFLHTYKSLKDHKMIIGTNLRLCSHCFNLFNIIKRKEGCVFENGTLTGFSFTSSIKAKTRPKL